MKLRVFHLASSLGPNAAGRTVARIVPVLPWDRIESLVVNLGEAISAYGVCGPRMCGPLRYPLDLARLVDIRRASRSFRPDVIHAWGPLALRVAILLRPRKLILSCGDRVSDPITKWLVRRAQFVTVTHRAEKNRFESMGVQANRIREIPFCCESATEDRVNIRQSLGLGDDAKFIVVSGGFDENAGLKYAIWAFDVIRQIHTNLHLVVLGDGPKRTSIERFARKLGQNDDRIHFLGMRSDAEHIIAAADLVWLTHRVGGLTVANEALAAGVPVLGFRTPDTLCLPIEPAQLVGRNDPIALATVTNNWLQSPHSVSPIAFPIDRLASALVTLYDDAMN